MALFGYIGMRDGLRQPVTIATTVRDNMLNILQLPTRVPVVLNITDDNGLTALESHYGVIKIGLRVSLDANWMEGQLPTLPKDVGGITFTCTPYS